MEYTAVRYPTKEYRQYRPGSKGLNVHYKAFREQFYGNKAIIKRSFRTIHRNPSVGLYTDQRGIPSFAYKIPNGKLYKTAPLMDRIPRGGNVPRVVGTLGDVQGPEFFQEGSYQSPPDPGSSLNSPFLFGKASQTLQDAVAQYQAQTGQPVNTKVIQSQAFKDFYTKVIKNTREFADAYNYHPENSKGIDELAAEQSSTQLNEATSQAELQVVGPAISTEPPQPEPNPIGSPMDTSIGSPSIGSPMDTSPMDIPRRKSDSEIYIAKNKQAQLARSQFPSHMLVDYALENQDQGDTPLQNGLRIQNPTANPDMITNPGNPQQVMQSMESVAEFDEDMFDNSTEQQITSAKDKSITLLKALRGRDKLKLLVKAKIAASRKEPSDEMSISSKGRSNSDVSMKSRSNSDVSSGSSVHSNFSDSADKAARTQLLLQGSINAIGRALQKRDLRSDQIKALIGGIESSEIQQLFPGKKGRGNALAEYKDELLTAIVEKDKSLQKQILKDMLDLLASKLRHEPDETPEFNFTKVREESKNIKKDEIKKEPIPRKRNVADSSFEKRRRVSVSGRAVKHISVKKKK
jgi:hypothetical protein